ncbi:MAG: DUF3168 domain-containing protein [Candidatus Korobacteraceae bacterium]|jgi:hypothetical protein
MKATELPVKGSGPSGIMIKQSAGYDLRLLIYNVLVADTTLTTREYISDHGVPVYARVYDTVPRGAMKPYVAVGKAAIAVNEQQPKDCYADKYMLEIDCFTHYGGKAQVSQIMNDVIAALYTAWAAKPRTLQFSDESPYVISLFEVGVRGEDVSVWDAKEAEHDVATFNIVVIQVQ